MREYFETMLKYQQAVVEAWVSASTMMMETYMHCLKQQAGMLDHAFTYHRPDDPTMRTNPPAGKRKGTKRPSPCYGPDLKDHYGKRHHDVDVEHI